MENGVGKVGHRSPETVTEDAFVSFAAVATVAVIVITIIAEGIINGIFGG